MDLVEDKMVRSQDKNPFELPIELWERILDIATSVPKMSIFRRVRRTRWPKDDFIEEQQQAIESRKYLCAFSLVCRSWLPSCRARQLEHPRFSSASQADLLIRILHNSPILCARVAWISIKCKPGDDLSWVSRFAVSLPRRVLRLQGITLHTVDLSNLHPSFYRHMSLFRPLTNLFLMNLRYSHFSQIDRLVATTQAEYVDLASCQWESPATMQCNVDIARRLSLRGRPPHLTGVFLYGNWSDVERMSRDWHFPTPSLQSVHIIYNLEEKDVQESHASVNIRAADLFRRLCNGNITSEYIDLRVQPLRQHFMFYFRRQRDIREYQRLHQRISLTLRIEMGWRNDDLIIEFASTNMPVLVLVLKRARVPYRSLELHVLNTRQDQHLSFYAPEVWAPLDDILAQPLYSSVFTVVIFSNKKADLPPSFRCGRDLASYLLPKLASRDLLGKCHGQCRYHTKRPGSAYVGQSHHLKIT